MPHDVSSVLLDSLVDDYVRRGPPAILDRCYDRFFCARLGLDYTEIYIYSRIEQICLSRIGAKNDKQDANDTG